MNEKKRTTGLKLVVAEPQGDREVYSAISGPLCGPLVECRLDYDMDSMVDRVTFDLENAREFYAALGACIQSVEENLAKPKGDTPA